MLAGATLPMFSIIFGDVINALGGSPTIAELVHQVNKVPKLPLLKLAIVSPSCSASSVCVAAGLPVFCLPGYCGFCCILW